jgi:hypothetical protein
VSDLVSTTHFAARRLKTCILTFSREGTAAVENGIEYPRWSLFDRWLGTVDIFAVQHRRPVRRNHFAVMALARTSGNKLHAYFTQFFFRFFLIDTKPCNNGASRNPLIG